MGCRPVVVVIVRVHKYENGSKKLKPGGLHEKHVVAIVLQLPTVFSTVTCCTGL